MSTVKGRDIVLRLSVVAIALLSAGCEKGGTKEADKPVALTPIQLSDEDLLQLGVKTLSSGPTITGSILPEKRADLQIGRAHV